MRTASMTSSLSIRFCTLLAGIITLAMAAITFGSYGAALLEGSDYPAILAKGLAIALIALLSVVIAIGTGAAFMLPRAGIPLA